MADGCSLSCTEKLGGGAGWPMDVALAAQRSWGGGRVADGCSCTEKLGGGGRVADGCSLSCTEKLGGGQGGRWV